MDREEKDNYLLNITASDGIFTAKATVEVKVLDANDNSPVCEKVIFFVFKFIIILAFNFTFVICLLHGIMVFNLLFLHFSVPQSLYSERVPEDSPAGRLILQVSATDADIRSNAQIAYELQGAGSELFIIDSDTGVYLCVNIN